MPYADFLSLLIIFFRALSIIAFDFQRSFHQTDHLFLYFHLFSISIYQY